MKTNLYPKPGTDLNELAAIFWDYNYTLTGKELFDFVLERKEISYLDRNRVKARMLMTVGWYRLIDMFGLVNLQCLLTRDVLKWVWVDDLRKQYALAGKVIKRTLSETIPLSG
ncbi:MAG: hypothetical protein GY757_19315 [bacterium]|nr:hypothetical protein [bacterium]